MIGISNSSAGFLTTNLVFLSLAFWPVSARAANYTIDCDSSRQLITMADGASNLVLRLNLSDRCLLDQVIVRGRQVAAP
jgi:hypothetical protein